MEKKEEKSKSQIKRIIIIIAVLTTYIMVFLLGRITNILTLGEKDGSKDGDIPTVVETPNLPVNPDTDIIILPPNKGKDNNQNNNNDGNNTNNQGNSNNQNKPEGTAKPSSTNKPEQVNTPKPQQEETPSPQKTPTPTEPEITPAPTQVPQTTEPYNPPTQIPTALPTQTSNPPTVSPTVAPTETPEIEDEDIDGEITFWQKNRRWDTLAELSIFNCKFYGYNYTNKIAPGFYGEYIFRVKNNRYTDAEYVLSFIEFNPKNVNMVYKLKQDGNYVLGNDTQSIYINNIALEKVTIPARGEITYTLYWKWEDTDYDTQIGQTGGEYKIYMHFDAEEKI